MPILIFIIKYSKNLIKKYYFKDGKVVFKNSIFLSLPVIP